jgi:hypothetical protein
MDISKVMRDAVRAYFLAADRNQMLNRTVPLGKHAQYYMVVRALVDLPCRAGGLKPF